MLTKDADLYAQWVSRVNDWNERSLRPDAVDHAAELIADLREIENLYQRVIDAQDIDTPLARVATRH